MINPIKHTISRIDRLWSEWVEATRKDVECTFGILKSRWLSQKRYRVAKAIFY
jgi:Plant transposon protein